MTLRHRVDVKTSSALPYMADRAKVYCTILRCDHDMCSSFQYPGLYYVCYPTYLVPSSRVRLLVITMIIFVHAFRSLAESHSSASVQFDTALRSSSQRARFLPFSLLPPLIIRNIIDFSKLFSLRMICQKYDICCFFMLPVGL